MGAGQVESQAAHGNIADYYTALIVWVGLIDIPPFQLGLLPIHLSEFKDNIENLSANAPDFYYLFGVF